MIIFLFIEKNVFEVINEFINDLMEEECRFG